MEVKTVLWEGNAKPIRHISRVSDGGGKSNNSDVAVFTLILNVSSSACYYFIDCIVFGEKLKFIEYVKPN